MRIELCSLSMTLGGVELRMGREARLLARAGYEPGIAVNLHPQIADWSEGLRSDGIPVHDYHPAPFLEDWLWLRENPFWDAAVWRRFRLRHKLWRIARRAMKPKARRYAREHYQSTRPDLVHLFLPWSGFEATRLFLAHDNHLPVVLSVRNAFPKCRWSDWHRQHYRAAFSSVHGVYAISRSALDLFVDCYGEFIQAHTVLEVIHNSVDTDRFFPNPDRRRILRQEFNLAEDNPVVGFVGRIEKQKRPQAMIQTFRLIKNKIDSAVLVLVGSGPMEADVRQSIQAAGLTGSVILAGWKPNVEDYLQGFDVVLQLSNNEGFGTATIEAMACGVPVVGTDVPGTRDILQNGRGGCLVPLNDEQAAADACIDLLSSAAKRCRFAGEAARYAGSQFDEKTWEERILNFYSGIGSRLPHRGSQPRGSEPVMRGRPESDVVGP
ncbi:MAG: glycosyltransferase [Desulfobacterales bacterium]